MVNIIHPADIEIELEKIWDSLQGTNKMRACLFNLVIYAKKSQRTRYLNEMTQKIIEKFPSRIIFITYNEGCSDQDLKAAVSVLTADEGEYEIVCDLIEIEVCNKDHPHLPFVILPHILPDLPIYLVHAGDPTFDNPVAEKLEHLADRIIFDSEVACDLPAYAKATLNHNKRCHADIADLNWARIEGWRRLFASVFKRRESLEDIKHTKKIQISYNSYKTDYLCHTNIQSLYLQGWLSVQLGWTLKQVLKGSEFFYEGEFGEIEVILFPDKTEKVLPGRILAIEIVTDRKIIYSFKRNKNCPDQVIIEKSSPEFCILPTNYIFDKDVSGQSLIKEIFHKGTSTHYIKLLALLSQINDQNLVHE